MLFGVREGSYHYSFFTYQFHEQVNQAVKVTLLELHPWKLTWLAGKSTCSIGNASWNGGCSIAMLAFGGVKKKHTKYFKKKLQQKPPKCLQFFKFPLLHKTLISHDIRHSYRRGKKNTQPLVYLFHAPRHVPAPSSGHKSQRIPATKKKQKSSDFWVAKFGANKKKLLGGFLPPLWKICSSKMTKWESSGAVGVKIKNIWNHHLEKKLGKTEERSEVLKWLKKEEPHKFVPTPRH